MTSPLTAPASSLTALTASLSVLTASSAAAAPVPLDALLDQLGAAISDQLGSPLE